jgi:energy-converting hydrogenase Eha subunit G
MNQMRRITAHRLIIAGVLAVLLIVVRALGGDAIDARIIVGAAAGLVVYAATALVLYARHSRNRC